MIDNKKILAIVPARGGSKRLPRKNVLPLAGKPLIAWTIEVAQKSRYLDILCVSTDDNEIAAVAKKFGAEVPFLRPPEISGDNASTYDAVMHALEYYEKNRKIPFDYVVLLQPTSPLRSSADIDESIRRCTKPDIKSIVGLCEMDHSPLWSNVLPVNGSLDEFLREDIKHLRSQDLPTYYRINGAIYTIRVSTLKQEKTFFPNSGSFAYIMPRERSVDIDTILDFNIAEAVYFSLLE